MASERFSDMGDTNPNILFCGENMQYLIFFSYFKLTVTFRYLKNMMMDKTA
jgi:hypothetical protein